MFFMVSILDLQVVIEVKLKTLDTVKITCYSLNEVYQVPHLFFLKLKLLYKYLKLKKITNNN